MGNTVSINIKENLARKINKISEETNKDTSYHVNKALENYIEEQEELKTAARQNE